MKRVRLSISKDRRVEAEREVRQYALMTGAGRPYRRGTDEELIWDFEDVGAAQMFVVGVRETPGVRVEE